MHFGCIKWVCVKRIELVWTFKIYIFMLFYYILYWMWLCSICAKFLIIQLEYNKSESQSEFFFNLGFVKSILVEIIECMRRLVKISLSMNSNLSTFIMWKLIILGECTYITALWEHTSEDCRLCAIFVFFLNISLFSLCSTDREITFKISKGTWGLRFQVFSAGKTPRKYVPLIGKLRRAPLWYEAAASRASKALWRTEAWAWVGLF